MKSSVNILEEFKNFLIAEGDELNTINSYIYDLKQLETYLRSRQKDFFSIETEEVLYDLIRKEDYTRSMKANRRRDKRSVSMSFSYSFGKMEQKRRFKGDREGFDGGGMDMSY